MRVVWEKDLSASDSIREGSVYGFCICVGVGVRSKGDATLSRPRSSITVSNSSCSSRDLHKWTYSSNKYSAFS